MKRRFLDRWVHFRRDHVFEGWTLQLDLWKFRLVVKHAPLLRCLPHWRVQLMRDVGEIMYRIVWSGGR